MNKIFYYSCIFLLLTTSKNTTVQVENSTKPNILWITTEDISPYLSFCGDTIAKTPTLNALAKQSVLYRNAFTTVGVCGPSRSSIITGMYPTSIGTMHMRTSHDVFSWGRRDYSEKVDVKDIAGKNIRKYSAVIPEYVKCFTEYLQNAGYYTTNNYKTDYQFAAPVTSWNENNQKAHWRNAPKNKPFFSVFNIDITHESYLWRNKDLPLTVNPKDVKVPPYLPDNSDTRNTIARLYSNIELMDKEVAQIINQLKEDGLYNNTIIFFFSDHGGPLPRQKREIYDSGLQVPFLVKGLNNQKGETDRLISFVDIAPTMLSLAGVKPPDYMEGYPFLGKYDTYKRDFICGTSDRFDEYTDRIRVLRNKKYLYVRNDFPNLPKYKDVTYRKNIPMMTKFLELRDNDNLTETQEIWFQTKTNEELYDVEKDPHQINNLADNKNYHSVLVSMRNQLEKHYKNRKDFGLIPESKMIERMWPNNTQPKTNKVMLTKVGNKINLATPTNGASIAYIISDKAQDSLDFDSPWKLYNKPVKVEKNQYIYAIAQRIGFAPSEIISKKIE